MCSKTHLFDVDIPGKITFKESDTLTPGSELTCLSTRYGKIGLGICYDLRFPELSMAYRAKGAELLVFPGAFNMTTGVQPSHLNVHTVRPSKWPGLRGCSALTHPSICFSRAENAKHTTCCTRDSPELCGTTAQLHAAEHRAVCKLQLYVLAHPGRVHVAR